MKTPNVVPTQLFFIFFLPVLLVACAPDNTPAEPPATETLSDAEARAIVDRMNAEWDAAVVAGDIDVNMEMYTEDAIRMQPDMPALVGRDAIRAWMQSHQDTYSFEGSNEIQEVRALSPDWILVRSTGSFAATPKAGGEVRTEQEQWLSIVQRQADGSWKWYRDAGSSVVPR